MRMCSRVYKYDVYVCCTHSAGYFAESLYYIIIAVPSGSADNVYSPTVAQPVISYNIILSHHYG